MEEINIVLDSVVSQLSDENYTQSFDLYRFWFDIGQTYYQISPDKIFDDIWNNRTKGSAMDFSTGNLIHLTAHLILRFARDAESDHILAPYSSQLQSRLCAASLREFFSCNLKDARGAGWSYDQYADVNFVAHWANLGYVEEFAIRNHILQSLISHPKLRDHEAFTLIIIFKVAGATFEAYADPSALNRCFELLKNHQLYGSEPHRCTPAWAELERAKQVCAPRMAKGGHRTEAIFQEVIGLRERGWEGLPPPPVLTTRRPRQTGANQRGPAASPAAAYFGLPNRDVEHQTPQPPPPEPAAVPGADTAPASPVTPSIQSPSISINSLSDFADASDDELPIDDTATVPHKTFYFEDGNVEVLCRNTLFRVHTSILSLHSPALRRIFAQSSLATVETPNGCPRLLSSDTVADFTTLLKIIYLPGFVAPPACHQILPLISIYVQVS